MIKWYDGQQLGMIIALDTETEMIMAPNHVPRLVITSVSDGKNSYLIKNKDLRGFLSVNNQATLIMHNATFDLSVISKYLDSKSIYLLAEEDRLWDTRIMYQLIKLAKTGISPRKNNLALVVKEFLGIELDKDAAIRCNFGQYIDTVDHVDYSTIEEKYLEYALKDASITYDLWECLYGEILSIEHMYDISGTGLSHKIQILGAIALDDIQKNGIGFDVVAKDLRLESIQAEILQHKELLEKHGWVRGLKGVKKKFAEIVAALSISLPLTTCGQVSSSAESLAPYVNDHAFINAYVKFHELEKLGTFIQGIETDRLYPRYNLLMNTGRTSSSSPNAQNLPRHGNIRELFIPAAGCVFVEIDYTALELCTLAQTTFNSSGRSFMRDLINEGKDLHVVVASRIYNIPESEIRKDQRQLAKILSFGLGANMSPLTFVNYAKGYNVMLSVEEATTLKSDWANIFPEIRSFWNIGTKTTNVLATGRVRSHCTYTALLNTYFQGLASDGAKLALYLVWRAGFKIIQFVHDSIVVEIREEFADGALKEVGELMIKGMKYVVPDVSIRVDGRITRNLGK